MKSEKEMKGEKKKKKYLEHFFFWLRNQRRLEGPVPSLSRVDDRRTKTIVFIEFFVSLVEFLWNFGEIDVLDGCVILGDDLRG